MTIATAEETTTTAECGPVILHCGAKSGEDCACGSRATTRCVGFDTDNEKWITVCDRSGEPVSAPAAA